MCHADALARLDRYAPSNAGSREDAGAGAASRTPGAAQPPHGDRGPNLVLASLVGLLALLGAGVVVRQERRRAAHRSTVTKA